MVTALGSSWVKWSQVESKATRVTTLSKQEKAMALLCSIINMVGRWEPIHSKLLEKQVLRMMGGERAYSSNNLLLCWI